MSVVLPDRAATAAWGQRLGRALRPGDVIALIGDLGAGKTTLTQAIAQGMGIVVPVTSPTFTLIHEYPGPLPLFHIDPYRLETPEDMGDLGFDEYFERGGVVVVEWADKIAALLPPERLTLSLEIAGQTNAATEDAPRRLTAAVSGARYERLLQALEDDRQPPE